MAQRKQLNKKISSDSQQTDDNTQEDESSDNRDNEYEHSPLLLSKSSREQRWKEREFKAKPKEMTEEEMMDLALRLSEKEASDTALQRQQEEEAVMKAIQESMVRTQPCLGSPSKSLLSDESPRLGPRRKLAYSNGERLSVIDQGGPKDSCTPEVDLNSDMTESEGENMTSKKKRKRRAGSPLLEMPDLSQSQKVSFQNLSSSSESLNSPQSSDSTQIDDSQVQKSPVFSLTGRRAAINIVRLNQGLVENCRSSGFYLCSQDSWTCSQKSVQPRSPTFPQTNPTLCSKSPGSSETNQGKDGLTELSPECVKSSDFGRNSPQELSSGACKLPDCENSAFALSSQESLTPSVMPCCPKSPVFPQSPHNSKILSPTDGSSSSRNHDQWKSKRNDECSTSPVFGTIEPQQRTYNDVQESEGLSAADLRGSNGREDVKSDGCSADEFNAQPPKSEKLNEKSKHWNSADTELTSDMTLVWTDEDEDDHVPVGSPSPVFPEERLVHQTESCAASPNHKTKEEKSRLDYSLKTQKCDPEHVKHTSNSKEQQLSTTEEKLHPISSQGAACRMAPQPRETSSGPTVHYYWGVPFCPQGLDPDRYTQVILAQMEVYEKSLKQAQRCLLKKVEWGEAIHPQPEKSPTLEAPAQSPQHQVPRRRGLRLRGRKTNKAAQSPSPEEEERKEEEEDKEEEQQQKKVEDEKDEGDEEQMDTDDCEVCPETQLSDNDSVQDLMMVTDGGSQKSPELPSVEMFLRGDSPVRDQQQGKEEEEEEEAVAETKTEERISSCGDDATVGKEKEVKEDRSDPDVEEIQNRVLQRSGSPELEVAVVPLSPKTSVDCPLCQGSFPVSEIEMHAAYCDGEVAVVSQRRSEGDGYQESVKLRRKKMRRAERTAEETACRNQEKCYICQKEVPLRDYSRHTELCLLRETSRTTAKENLLSALEQTENRDSDAGPSGSRAQPEVVIDLLDDDEEEEEKEEEPAVFRVSNSPIRSFTSISEATGCLINFKKHQRGKKPSQRRR